MELNDYSENDYNFSGVSREEYEETLAMCEAEERAANLLPSGEE